MRMPHRPALALIAMGVFVLAAQPSQARAAEPDARLVTAAASQDWTTVRALLKQGAPVNQTRADGATALLWAAHWDKLDIVDLLLRSGAAVNKADDHGVTPLARASESASPSMVARLLKAGANPNLAETSGMTPLMVAAQTGSLDVVRSLLVHGANVNAATSTTGATALMWATAESHRDIMRVLVEGGADVNVSTTKGLTPLMFAARNGDLELGALLVDAGAKVNQTGADGTHVLPYSIVSGQAAFAKFLLDRGADPNGSMNGVRALHAAASGVDAWLNDWYRRHGLGSTLGFYNPGGRLAAPERVDLIKALVAKGADVNARIETSALFMSYIAYPRKGAFEPFSCGTGDVRGATPLWVAAYAANGNASGFGGNMAVSTHSGSETSVDVVRALLALGADLKLTSADGTTPLMVAAGLGRCTFTPDTPRAPRSETAEQAVNVLLDAGAEINATNEADFTALHGAAMRGLNEVIQQLVRRGAAIDARDFRGRTAYRMAEGAKQSFQFQAWPETAAFMKGLGANTRIGLAGTVQERIRDITAAQQ